MSKLSCLAVATLLTLAVAAHADPGVDRMKAIQEAVGKGDISALPTAEKSAVQSGMQNATVSANPANFDPHTVQFSQDQVSKWD